MKLNKNINHKQKILIGLSANLIISALIGYFFVFAYLEKVVTANAMLSDFRVDFETKLIKEEKFSKITKNLTKIESDVKKIDRAFINKNMKLEFITMFESIAEDNAVEMEMDINFERVSSDKSIPLILKLKGSYSNLLNFLVELENLDFYVNVDKLDISNSRTINSKASALNNLPSASNLSMIIEAKTYWR